MLTDFIVISSSSSYCKGNSEKVQSCCSGYLFQYRMGAKRLGWLIKILFVKDLSELYKYSTNHDKSQGYSDTSSREHPSLQHSSTALISAVLRVMECLLFQDRSRKSLAFSAEMATPESQKQRMFYAKSKYDPAPSGIICCVYLLYRLVSRAHLDKRIPSLPRLLCSRVVVFVVKYTCPPFCWIVFCCFY